MQRKYKPEHANDLIKIFVDQYAEYGEIPFLETVQLARREDNKKYYIIDGQHRLGALNALYKQNKYPIQKIPVTITEVKNEHEMIELFKNVNNRLNMNTLELCQDKILNIEENLTQKYNKIFGTNRPYINQSLFRDKLKNGEFIHVLNAEQITKKIIEINEALRSKPRKSRTIQKNVSAKTHAKAEEIDFFLGLDKTLSWIDTIN